MDGSVPVIVVNVVCSLGVIFVNKHLFAHLGFAYAGILTGLHFVANSLLSWFLVHRRFEDAKILDWRAIVILAAATCISIFLSNLSLFLNSVGFYQIAKLSVIPCTLVLHYLLFQAKINGKTAMSLLVLTAGLGIATVTQVNLQPIGFGVALLGVVSTSLQQIVYSEIMKEQKLNGVQLYYNIGPLSAVIMFFGGFFVDAGMNEGVFLFQAQFTQRQMLWVLLSCVLAAPMNFTSALLLAKTSPVTFQVLGHVKNILVFAIGIVFFSSTVNWENVFGIIVAMVGVVWYTKIQSESK